MSGSIYVEDVGAGMPVLAIHGLGGGAHFFSGLARRLQRECRMLSMDLPGTGRSPGRGVVSMQLWVEQLAELIASRVSEPVVLLGHSLGTIIALKAWQAWPEMIRGLVFAGGLPEVRPAVRSRLEQRIEALRGISTLAGWGPNVSPANFSQATFRERPEIVAMFERLFEAQSIEAYAACIEILLSSSAAAVPATLRVPSLAITGADDQYAPPDDVAAFVRSIPASASFEVLLDCGHLPFLEQPEAFAGALKAFLLRC